MHAAGLRLRMVLLIEVNMVRIVLKVSVTRLKISVAVPTYALRDGVNLTPVRVVPVDLGAEYPLRIRYTQILADPLLYLTRLEFSCLHQVILFNETYYCRSTIRFPGTRP